MSCWFLLSTALLLQSTNNLLVQSGIVQATSQQPWTTSGIHHHHPTRIDNHERSLSLMRLLTLRAGDIISDDDDSTSNHSRRRRKRKRVRLDDPSAVEKGGEINVDDAAVASTQQQLKLDSEEEDSKPVKKKEKRKRRRLFSRNIKDDDTDPSIDEGIDNQEEDVLTTSSNNEAGKRIKKRRRKKVVGETNEVEESIPSCEEDVGVEDGIPKMVGEAADEDDDTHSSPEDGNELDNTEMTQTTKGTKKRKRRKKLDASTIVQDTVDDTIVDEDRPEAIDAQPLPLMAESVENSNEDESRAKKRKRKKRRTNIIVPDSDGDGEEKISEVLDASQEYIESPSAEEMNKTSKKKRRRRRGTNNNDVQAASDDVINEEEPSLEEAIDTSPLPSINASVEIPSEEIVPESIGSPIEVNDSLSIPPMDDGEVEELPSEEAVIDSAEKETEPVSDGEYNVEPAQDVLVEAENEKVEESPLLASDDGESITIIDDSADKESDGEYTVESTEEVVAGVEDGEVEELPSEEAVDDSAEKETEPVLDDKKSITIIDDSADMESDKVPAEADNEEVEELPLEGAEAADDNDNDDEVEHLVIDVSVEIPEEENVPESADASIEVEEDFRADAFEDADESLNDMNVFVNNEDVEEDNEEEGLQESNVDTSSGENESEIQTLLPEESVAFVEDAPTSEIEVIPDDIDDKSTEEDGGDSDKNEEKGEMEQSNSPDVGELSTQSSDQPTEPENHESETEGIVSQEESLEEENVVVDEDSSVQLDQANINVGDNSEEATNIDQNSIELEKMESDCLTVSVVTWNLAESSFSEEEATFFKRFRKGSSKIGSDLVLIGAQECEDIKPRRSEGHRSRHLRRVGIQMLGRDYIPLAIHSLGGIQMALYCHRDVLEEVEMVNIADVTCGVGNVFHNKGAIGVYLKMKRFSGQKDEVAKTSRMLFVTGHLAAHVKNVDARNDDFKRIISGLEAQAPARFLRPKRNPDGSPSECDGSYLLNSMDHVFFAGDLNYRVDLPREYVERCIIDIKENQTGGKRAEVDALMNKLLRRDQLLQTISSGRAFPKFSEGKITFLPTFKFDKGTQKYDTSHKQRVPAWTDRILFRSSKVDVLEYQSVPEAMHSDHRPVFGTYQLGWGVTTTAEKRRGGKRGRRNRKK